MIANLLLSAATAATAVQAHVVGRGCGGHDLILPRQAAPGPAPTDVASSSAITGESCSARWATLDALSFEMMVGWSRGLAHRRVGGSTGLSFRDGEQINVIEERSDVECKAW